MSRKKISTTVSLAADVYERLELEKNKQERSFAYIVEEALRERFKMEGGPKPHADQKPAP